jgi:hypothetical protein
LPFQQPPPHPPRVSRLARGVHHLALLMPTGKNLC